MEKKLRKSLKACNKQTLRIQSNAIAIICVANIKRKVQSYQPQLFSDYLNPMIIRG